MTIEIYWSILGIEATSLGGVGLEREKLNSDEVKSQIKSVSGMFQRFEEAYQLQMSYVHNAIRAMISIPKIVIPKLELSINWGDFSERFAEECRRNAKYGWCLSSEMGVSEFREIARSADNQEVKDAQFVSMFERNDFKLYKSEKEFIISQSSDEWKLLYEDCFNAFENDLHRLVIPSLIMGIEHELYVISKSEKYGLQLVRKLKSDFLEDYSDERLTYALNAPVFSVLENSLFKYAPFESDKPDVINRNWVLHGRDDPASWSKIECYKLMTVISAIKLLSF